MASVSSWIKPEGTFRLRQVDIPLALIVVYAVALLAIPTDVGLHLGF